MCYRLLSVLFVTALFYGSSAADQYHEDPYSMSLQEPRFLFNTSSNLVQLNATLLAVGLVALGVAVAAAVALYYVYTETTRGYSGSYSNSNSYSNNYAYQNYARSNDVYDFSSFNVLEWIAVMRDMYENFDMNDLECQKRLICEVARSEDTFGRMSRNLRTGFKYAKYLEMLNLPDDFREVLDEYMDASEQAEGPKDCREFFQCPYSIKDSLNRNLSNHL